METMRLRAEPLNSRHAKDIYRLASLEAVARYMRFSRITNLAEACRLIEEYTAPGCHAFALYEKEGGRFAGLFALKPAEQKKALGISVFFHPDCWGRGYAQEVTGFFISYARQKLAAHALLAWVVEENTASRRVLEKLGFVVIQALRFDDLPSHLLVYQLFLGN